MYSRGHLRAERGLNAGRQNGSEIYLHLTDEARSKHGNREATRPTSWSPGHSMSVSLSFSKQKTLMSFEPGILLLAFSPKERIREVVKDLQ